MENSEFKKHFISIIITYCIWVVMCGIIVYQIASRLAAQVDLGGDMDVTSIVGIILASTFGFGVAGLGIILSIVGITLGEKKPLAAKGFGITNFVLILTCLGTMIAGAILIARGISQNIVCSLDPSETAEWRQNCAEDVIANYIEVACMLVMVGVSVIGIVGSVKVVVIMSKTMASTGIVSAAAGVPARNVQPVTATGTQGKFCAACGAPNEPDAKFCKKCGKAC